MSNAPSLKRTPLYDTHVRAGARMIEFGGWHMPVQYNSLLVEHRAVRRSAGLFDLSHMGEFAFRGADTEKNLQRLLTNDVSSLAPGRAQYTLICNERGGIVDDVIIYRLDDEFLMVVNAANIDKDRQWLQSRLEGDVVLDDQSDATGLLAVQGPSAALLVAQLADDPQAVEALPAFGAIRGAVAGVSCLLSRTGYTGEDGFELYCPADSLEILWNAIMEAGAAFELVPAGLGARDTLRLEARLPLYGNELNEETTPYQAGLGFAVKLDKGEFVGRDALLHEKENGPHRRLVGFVMQERGGAPRTGYRVLHQGEPVGEVTSGSFSPSLEKDIGLAYVPPTLTEPGTELEIEIRNRRKTGVVHKGRFIPSHT